MTTGKKWGLPELQGWRAGVGLGAAEAEAGQGGFGRHQLTTQRPVQHGWQHMAQQISQRGSQEPPASPKPPSLTSLRRLHSDKLLVVRGPCPPLSKGSHENDFLVLSPGSPPSLRH